MKVRGDCVQVLREVTLDKLINLYEGIVVHDRKQLIEWKDHCGIPLYEMKQRTLAQDKMILGALKCAKANGYSREESKRTLPTVMLRSVFLFVRLPFPIQ